MGATQSSATESRTSDLARGGLATEFFNQTSERVGRDGVSQRGLVVGLQIRLRERRRIGQRRDVRREIPEPIGGADGAVPGILEGEKRTCIHLF